MNPRGFPKILLRLKANTTLIRYSSTDWLADSEAAARLCRQLSSTLIYVERLPALEQPHSDINNSSHTRHCFLTMVQNFKDTPLFPFSLFPMRLVPFSSDWWGKLSIDWLNFTPPWNWTQIRGSYTEKSSTYSAETLKSKMTHRA